MFCFKIFVCRNMKENGFKRLPNLGGEIDPTIYNHLTSYIEVLEGVARLTNQNIALIDFHKEEILYISDSPLFLYQYSPEEIKKMGSKFNRQFVPEEDMEMMQEIFVAWNKFLLHRPIDERKDYSLHVDYHLNKNLIKVCMTPAFLNKEGRIWIAVFISKISTHSEAGNAVIFKINSTQSWHYSFATRKWIEKKQKLLSATELQILRLATLGKKENEICEIIHRSKDALKSMKRKIYKKIEVDNITEAVSFAITHGMI